MSDKTEQFIEKIKSIYPSNWEEVIKTHYNLPPKTFRINTLLSSEKEVLDLLKEESFEIIKADIPNAYICLNSTEDHKISDSKVHLENKIYIQELSSMLPALALNPQKGDEILDMCAAPGSKTTQLGILTNNQVNIVAVEKSTSRFFKMNEIIKNQGVKNVKTILTDGNRLITQKREYFEHFDKVIVDVPCSNEGSLDLSHTSTLKFWSGKEAKRISKLQKGLLNNAVKMLKKGGTLIYSTCTYSVEENEIVLDWLLKRYSDIKIVKSDLKLDNLVPALTEWKEKKLNPQIKNAVRVLPDGKFKGFFIAKIVKY